MDTLNTLLSNFDDSKVQINDNKSLSTDETVVQYAGIMEGSAEYAEIIKEINKNTYRGLAVYFRPGDRVALKPWNQLPVKITGFESANGKLLPLCSAWAVCSRPTLGTFELSMSLLRRIPTDVKVDLVYNEEGSVIRSYIFEEENHKEIVEKYGEDNIKTVDSHEYLLKDNPIGEVLCKAMSDWDRCKFLAGKCIECTEKIRLFKPHYEDGRRISGEYDSITCYKFKEVTE